MLNGSWGCVREVIRGILGPGFPGARVTLYWPPYKGVANITDLLRARTQTRSGAKP